MNLGCSSAKFSTHAVSFSKVCGRVIGIQYYSPEAFDPYYGNQGRTIDDSYVDGVSITHSSSPRQHIWTFAAAYDEVPSRNAYACPCVNSLSHHRLLGEVTFSSPAGQLELVLVMLTLATLIHTPSPQGASPMWQYTRTGPESSWIQ